MPIKKQTNKLINFIFKGVNLLYLLCSMQFKKKMKEKQKQPPSAYFIIKRTDQVVNYLIF